MENKEPNVVETGLVSTTAGPPAEVNLQDESKALIKQIIAETDVQKSDELMDLFNMNQKKKTIVRVNKLNDLMDAITDSTIERFVNRSNEITTQENIQALKTVYDIIDRSQKSVAAHEETPLIQINQQTNEVNVGDASSVSKESRDKVKSAVASILANINNQNNSTIEVDATGENDDNRN